MLAVDIVTSMGYIADYLQRLVYALFVRFKNTTQMMTPLLFCVNRGYMEIVRQLIDMGADRNVSDKNVKYL